MKQILFIILTIGLVTCNTGKKESTLTNEKIDEYDYLVQLYHLCDTILRLDDTILIVNNKFDTTITETGIFTFLQYDYPLTTPEELVGLSRIAVQNEKEGKKEKAEKNYKDIVDFYVNKRPKQLQNFSCMNGYLQYEVNSAILVSYAHEKLGDDESALKDLQPFLANTEANSSKIHKRYIELCINKFGIEKVRKELNMCGRTIKYKKQISPEKDDWIVNVLGADIGLGKSWEYDKVSVTQADSIIRKMNFYKMIE